MECEICLNAFDRSKRLPQVVSPCSHTFCIDCLMKANSNYAAICHDCHSAISAKNTNWILLKMIPASKYDDAKIKAEQSLTDTEHFSNKLNEEQLNNFKENQTRIKNFIHEINFKAAEIIELVNDHRDKLISEAVAAEEKLNEDRNNVLIDEELNETKLDGIKQRIACNTLNESELTELNREIFKIKEDLDASLSHKNQWDDYSFVHNKFVFNEKNLVGEIINGNQTK